MSFKADWYRDKLRRRLVAAFQAILLRQLLTTVQAINSLPRWLLE